MRSPRHLVRMLMAGGVVAALLANGTASVSAAVDKGPGARDITYTRWTSSADFATGVSDGVATAGDTLTMGNPVGTIDYADPFGDGSTRRYDYSQWTSPLIAPGYAATEAIPSWSADTPSGTWIQINMRGVTQEGSFTKWYIMGRWAADDSEIHPTSVPAQGDDNGFVAIDTFIARDGRAWTNWQLQVVLLRPAGTTGTASVRDIGAMVSRLPQPGKLTPTTPSGIVRTLPVPQYSQEVHIGHYPQWDNGGEAWCSPTSTSMAVGYWGTGPTPADYDWVEPKPHADPWVDYTARRVFDYNYDGAGNWPFNTAYAARFGLEGFVTRLRSLNEAEQFIAAGIPLVVSASWKKNEVPGADYGTNGHLAVIVGFDAAGNPVMNDPFAPSDAEVRKTFGRAEFESVWLNHSGGVTYVIHPPGVPLPPSPSQPNW